MACSITKLGYKTENSTLTIYKSKPKKKMFVLNSIREFIPTEKNDLRILETIRFYNGTKFGMDMTDQMARK